MERPCAPESRHGCSAQLVCRCLNVTRDEIVEAITSLGLQTLKEVRQATGAGGGCTCCHKDIRLLLEQYSYSPPPSSSSALPICSLK
ncbi:MAG: (2Fe-2S)-binding protein [Gemmataceae bacterium]|nr:(2Fe-2S)-binding protein [Gemmataceae bacterium]